MARDKGNTAVVEDEAPVVESTESETTEADTTATPVESKPEPNPLLLEAFKQAVQSAVEQRDPDTGELSNALTDPVSVAFRELDGTKQRNAAKNVLIEGAKSALMATEGDMTERVTTAKAYVLLQNVVGSVTTKTKAEPTPVDPAEARAVRQATLQMAYGLVAVQDELTESVNEKVSNLIGSVTTEQIDAYQAWLDQPREDRGDAPELPTFAVQAVKLANGKTAKTGSSKRAGSVYSGPRRSIGNHVESAFANLGSGAFLKISEIAGHKSEEYGDEQPSSGAISAYLFEPKDDTKKGVSKGDPRQHEVVSGYVNDGDRGGRKN